MVNTMKNMLICCCLLIPVALMAADAHEVDRLMRQCDNEQSSLLRERYGIPSCEQLDRLHYAYPKISPPSMQPQTKPSHVHSSVDNASDYRWSGMHGKYCNFDKDGNVTMCY